MPELLDRTAWVALFEFIGALAVVAYGLAAVRTLLSTRQPDPARRLMAEGALTGLTFKLAATLLNALGAPSWDQLARLAVMIALRTLLKQLFAWEQGRLRRP